MKRIVLILMLVTMLVLSGCSSEQNGKLLGDLGVDISTGTVVKDTDTHGGFHGDGMSFLEVAFGEEAGASNVEKLEAMSAWQPLSLTENLTKLIYGYTKDNQFHEPYLKDDAGEPLFPKVHSGYYYFYDRHSESKNPKDDEALLTRSSKNFTFAIYDTSAHKFYYCKFDT